VIDRRKRLPRIYSAPDRFVPLGEQDALDGGDILPGFSLPLHTLFARLGPARERARGQGKRRKSG
jgi:hypothetical protein